MANDTLFLLIEATVGIVIAVVVITVLIAVRRRYKHGGYAEAGDRKKGFYWFPKFYKVVPHPGGTAEVAYAAVKAVLAAKKFKIMEEKPLRRLRAKRGFVLGDFSAAITQILVRVEVSPDRTEFYVEYGQFALSDTGDLWTLTDAIAQGISSSLL